MTDQHYDAIIVGSGAGGAATAFNLVRAGKRALVLERGDRLPRENSCLKAVQKSDWSFFASVVEPPAFTAVACLLISVGSLRMLNRRPGFD